jgi:hypothetical protein
MRVVRRRNHEKSGSSQRLGAVMLGALAGVAVGVLLADRGIATGLRRRRAAVTDGDPPETRARRTPLAEMAPLTRDRMRRSTAADDQAALEARVLETFRNDPVLMDRPIDIGAIGTGIIELTGWVDAPEEVRLATTLTRGTIGVNTVVNRLLVRGGTPTA